MPDSGDPARRPHETSLDDLLRVATENTRPSTAARAVLPVLVTALAVCSGVFAAGIALQAAAWSLAGLAWLLWLARLWSARLGNV
ncbi:MAG TPA: hypothetical protein VJT49_31090 [Amycolatopsis sp.]|uniref:hypothetical protein n=1 Tax=Amycolatopsis sp. TaxID=37632 RepID=UPI002B46840D|nr:hypothetical protein [Amycolatopsis sp.]HKS49479.1 hypothetical protein [Amycolatopsis sp.]